MSGAFVVAVGGQKGGCGKSTVSTNLAAEGVRRGLSVLLLDADTQRSAATWAAVGREAGAAVPDTLAVLLDEKHPQLPEQAAGYALVVLDLPPALGAAQRAAMVQSDVVLIPCGASPADLWSTGESEALVAAARGTHPALRAAYVLNRLRRTAFSAQVRGALKSSSIPTLRAALSQRAAYEQAMAVGAGVTTYAPSSPAALEVRDLFAELFRFAERKAPRG